MHAIPNMTYNDSSDSMREWYVYNCLYTNHSDNLMAQVKVVEKREKANTKLIQ